MTVTGEQTKGVKLTRSDVRNLDTEATQLVMDATASGWTGQVGNRGHVFMFAPDGVGTMSVSRSSRGRTGKNARAEFSRWQREHESEPATSAFGTLPADDGEGDLGFPLINGKPAPTALLAAVRRSEKLAEARAAWRDKHGPNRVMPWLIGVPGEPDQVEPIDPAAWFAFHLAGKTPTLLDHGPNVTEEQAWIELHNLRPDLFTAEKHAQQDKPGEGDVRVFRCSECGKEYEKAGALNLHISAKHPVDIECPECGRVVRGQGGLGAHMRSHRKKAEAQVAGVAVTVDDTTVAPPPDVLTEHLVNLPEGDDAELMVAQVRSVVAAGLVNEVRALRVENERLARENEKLATQAADWEARYAIIREAMTV